MSKYNVYVEDVSVEAVFNILGGVDGARRLLRGELVVSEPIRPWYEKDGIIYLSSPLIADGTTGADWITRLEGAGKSVSRYAKSVLRSVDFVPSPAGTVYQIAILKGSLFEDSARITANICAKATELGFTKLHAEVACLIREKFSDDDIKAMGLWRIIAMHDPFEDSDGSPDLLGACRDDFDCSLNAYYDRPGFRWYSEDGFAFQQV
ncbi:hypothetical protein KKH24_02410 [Patescibacteria group bacterium]|nr:hypothetical protein [Patescibacteria group bacterium]